MPGAPGTRSLPWDSIALPTPQIPGPSHSHSHSHSHCHSQSSNNLRHQPSAASPRRGVTATLWSCQREFASKKQCLGLSFLTVSLPVLAILCFAMIFFLNDPSRLHPEYAWNCMENADHTKEYLCGIFAVLSFLGTVGFLVLWVPILAALLITVYKDKFASSIAAQLLAVTVALFAGALFSFGIILIVRSDRKWAFYTYSYIAIILGGALGLIVIALGSFYLGSVLVLQIFTMMGYTEDEVRREFMYGGGGNERHLSAMRSGDSDSEDDMDDDIESNVTKGDLMFRPMGGPASLSPPSATSSKDYDGVKRSLKREKHKLEVERHRLEKLDEILRKRELEVQEREEDLENFETRLQKREQDIEDAEEELARQRAELQADPAPEE
eukprot:CAMPEP_0171489530 /NCGR_PEP_ID=MMETSP0958-20121227/2810_1 /TAXON_ID=87120 /ORGANISM="Aurantiochytrium limacinum, Strain ATCCMYA-1381" /LENGTH=382 /DNA_ID=CAMNT_0012022757 /DNA_START=286 /DNA_END=1434 /DNA_ORIENTATION=-